VYHGDKLINVDALTFSFMDAGSDAWYTEMDRLTQDMTEYESFEDLCACVTPSVLSQGDSLDVGRLRDGYLFKTGRDPHWDVPVIVGNEGCRYMVVDDMGVMRCAGDTLREVQGAGYIINDQPRGRIIIDFKYWRIARDGYRPNVSLCWGQWPWVVQVSALRELIIRAQEVAGVRVVRAGGQVVVSERSFLQGAEIVCCDNVEMDINDCGNVIGRPILRKNVLGMYQAYLEIQTLNGRPVDVPEFGMILYADDLLGPVLNWCNEHFCREERLVLKCDIAWKCM